MKRLLLATALFSYVSTFAQLKVDSVGKVGVGGSAGTYSQMKIQTPLPSAIHIESDRRASYSCADNYGINLTLFPNATANAYGLNSYVNAWLSFTYPNYTFGVKASAMGGNVSNFGLFGECVPYPTGAGVVGCANFVLPTLYQGYAGFFYGPTYVAGDLTVTGTVNGVVLGTSPSSSPRLQDPCQVEDLEVRTRFQSLRPSAFYLEKRNDYTLQLDTAALNQCGLRDQISLEDLKIDFMEKQTLSKKHYGVPAEQLEAVFPDLVYENEDGTKSVNYIEMVPLLLQAINELNAKVEALESGNVKKEIETVTNRAAGQENSLLLLSLGQNKPNPFSSATTIEVCIPEDVQKAFIYVYDLQGKKVEQVDITARGKQNIQLTSANLTDGMYLYSLIADGKVVETRRMIVEK